MRAFWALLWRSLALLPLAIVFLFVFIGMWVAIVMLPIAGIISLFQAEWLHAIINFLIWIPLLFMARWKVFRVNPKDILNEQENV